MPSTPGLRERTRRAVQGELVEAAQALFVRRGYEATTVEGIAAAAGMSRRSFFRYFASKEDLVLGKYDLMGERLVEGLTGRPPGEDVWVSLRRAFDEVVTYVSDEVRQPEVAEMERIVLASPALHAAYLGRMDAVQQRLADVLRLRAAAAGAAPTDGDPLPRALVGAAFACFEAARWTPDADRDLAAALDRTMRAIRASD